MLPHKNVQVHQFSSLPPPSRNMLISPLLPILNPSSSSPSRLPAKTPCSQFNKTLNPLSLQNLSKTTSRPTTAQSTHAHHLRHLIESKNLAGAKNFYADATGQGAQFGVVLESILIDAFMKSGRVSDALQVFEAMPERNVVTWTSMIQGSVKNGDPSTGLSLFVKMVESDATPNDFAFCAALRACADLGASRFGGQLASLMVRLGLEGDCRVMICLMDFYSRCGSMDEAVRVFDGMVDVDVVGFTSLISGFVRNGMFCSAVRVFDRMMGRGIEPNEYTITSILTACGPLLGEQIHAYMVKSMINHSVYSTSALIELYCKDCKFSQAKMLFDKFDNKNVVTWSTMISSYLHNNQVEDALRLLHEMFLEGISPNEFTFAIAIQACGMCSGYLQLGQLLHCLVVKLNLVLNNRISNALISMYSKNGEVEASEKVFERATNHDVVTWSTMISGCFQNGLNEKSIRLLYEMHKQGYTPNEYGLSSVLSACASFALLEQGRQFHCLALKLGCDLDICTANALVNMYGKCGFLDDARVAFDVMNTHDLMSWNSLIHGYAHHGHGRAAIEVFDEMVELNCSVPDHSTFVAILVACNHVGCVDKAVEYFKVMEDVYHVTPSSSHYACMVDMMGRAGRLNEALYIIEQMAIEPNVLIWKTFLGSCGLHGNLELGKLAADKVLELSPGDSAAYVLLSNLHAMHGEWGDVEKIRMMMDEMGVKKDAGCSWIEVKSEVHAFVARDESHPQSELIHQRLVELDKVIRAEGNSIDYMLEYTHTECET